MYMYVCMPAQCVSHASGVPMLSAQSCTIRVLWEVYTGLLHASLVLMEWSQLQNKHQVNPLLFLLVGQQFFYT